MRRLLIILLSIMMLVSCSDERSAIISSEDGAEIWIAASDEVVVITSSRNMQSELEKLSGQDAGSALSELFGIDDLTTVDAESFRKRREMLLLLADVTDRNAYDARVFYDRDLEDTVFFSNLSELSSSFDDFLSDEVIKGRKKCREYRMERILPSLSTYDDVKVFVSRWKESIIERIENK